jgi:hypothetical protein
VRVLAATFSTVLDAKAAAGVLEMTCSPKTAVQIAKLGQASDPAGPAAVLAGRFLDDVISTVRRTVEAAGGRVEFEIDAERVDS